MNAREKYDIIKKYIYDHADATADDFGFGAGNGYYTASKLEGEYFYMNTQGYVHTRLDKTILNPGPLVFGVCADAMTQIGDIDHLGEGLYILDLIISYFDINGKVLDDFIYVLREAVMYRAYKCPYVKGVPATATKKAIPGHYDETRALFTKTQRKRIFTAFCNTFGYTDADGWLTNNYNWRSRYVNS